MVKMDDKLIMMVTWTTAESACQCLHYYFNYDIYNTQTANCVLYPVDLKWVQTK